jgi:acetyl esterase/lipase
MLTEPERAIIKKWNDFSTRPRGNITSFRDDLDKFCVEMRLNDDLPTIGAFHENVELRSGLRADISVPKGIGPHPVMLFIHGGGWMAGNPRTHRKLAMQFAERGYLTVNVDYRLAPEHPFPAGFDDCVFAAKWIGENVQRWNGDSSRTAIAGDSAGANLAAAALVALSGDPSAPKFHAGALIYGIFDFPAAIERSPNRSAIEGMARLSRCSISRGAQRPAGQPTKGGKAGSATSVLRDLRYCRRATAGIALDRGSAQGSRYSL